VDPAQIQFILMILKLVCPELKRMAKESPNPFDDFIVNLVCSMATLDTPKDILLKGGK
jgi:hypothetical protein